MRYVQVLACFVVFGEILAQLLANPFSKFKKANKLFLISMIFLKVEYKLFCLCLVLRYFVKKKLLMYPLNKSNGIVMKFLKYFLHLELLYEHLYHIYVISSIFINLSSFINFGNGQEFPFRSIGSQLVLRDAMLIVAMDRLLNKSGSWMILQV